jgi:Leucine-rich repeat (LRR) protein
MNTNNIKKIRLLLSFAGRNAIPFLYIILCLLFTDCKDKKITMTVDTQSLALPPLGGETIFTVSTNAGHWSAVSNANWLSVTRQGTSDVKIQAGPCLDVPRSAKVNCSVAEENILIEVTVQQSPVTALQSDSLALVGLYQATGGPNWTKATGWLSLPLRSWQGVEVADGRVSRLNLPSSNMAGQIPENAGRLSGLQYCDLSGNRLLGTLPAGMSAWPLRYLDLSDNDLSGSVPNLSSSKLLVCDLSMNELTNLPQMSPGMDELEYLSFHKNKFQGNIPSNWSSYRNLIYIDVSLNTFTGNIPNEWSVLTNMKALHLYGNELSGNIPAYVTAFTYLESLALHQNDLTGSIPADLGTLSQLESLWLSQNRLTGEIPQSLLSNPHWNEWKEQVGPQQSGYGFSNYSPEAGIPATRLAEAPTPSDIGKRIKKEIRSRLESSKE